MISAILYRFC